MVERVCESCGAGVEPELQVDDRKPAVLIVTPRYCDDCLEGEEVGGGH